MKDLEKNQFKDGEGRVWSFRVTASHVLKIKQMYNFDVRDIENADRVADLLDSPDLVIFDIMAMILMDQIESRQLTPDCLFSSLDGDTVPEAILAFIYGTIFFFPLHRRKAAEMTVSLVLTNQSQSGYLLAEMLANPETVQAMGQKMSQSMKQETKPVK